MFFRCFWTHPCFFIHSATMTAGTGTAGAGTAGAGTAGAGTAGAGTAGARLMEIQGRCFPEYRNRKGGASPNTQIVRVALRRIYKS